MKIRFGQTFLATGTLLLAAVSACSNDASKPPALTPTTSTTSSSSGTVSSTPPASPSDAASRAASAMMKKYFAVVDGLRSDPSSKLGPLQTVATSAQLNALRTLIRRQHDQGQRQTGTTSVNELTVQSVDLTNTGQASGNVPTVVLDVCWDVSTVDVLDATGKSIVAADRPDTGWTRFTVVNYRSADDPTGGWLVATGQDLKQPPCAAA